MLNASASFIMDGIWGKDREKWGNGVEKWLDTFCLTEWTVGKVFMQYICMYFINSHRHAFSIKIKYYLCYLYCDDH